MKILFILTMIVGIVSCLFALEFVADANTVALWHFNEASGDTVYDFSTNSNNGYISGAARVDGLSGKALQFDGINDYVRYNNSSSFENLSRITISMWFYFRYNSYDFTGERLYLIDKNGAWRVWYSPNNYVNANEDQIFFDIWDWQGVSTQGVTWVPGEWYLINLTYDSSHAKVYINGKLNNTAAISKTLNSNSADVYLGCTDGSTYFFNGIIDEVRISNIARDPSEIAAHWEANRDSAALDLGLIAYYPFNGNANDESNNNNHGTVNGATLTTDRFGNANNAYSFDGIDDYIDCGNDTSLDVTDGITVCVWMYTTNNTDEMHPISKGTIYSSWDLIVYNPNMQYEFRVKGPNLAPPCKNILTNEWVHLVGVYNGSSVSVYQNGNLCVSEQGSGSIPTTSALLLIGKDKDSRFEYEGKLDEIRIYDRALSSTEIYQLYTQGIIIPELIAVESPTLNRRPLLQWYVWDDTASYQVQIDTTKNFNSPIVSIIVTDTTFTPLADLPMQTIYWRVGAGSPIKFSNIDSFVIQNPVIPMLITYEPNPTIERKPALTWHSVENASAYHIMIDNNSDFSSAEVSLAVVDTFFTPLSDLPYGMIYWKVKSDVYDEYSPASTFYIQPDTIPFLYAFNGAATSNKRPEFMWIPVSSASTYKIQIDTSLSFSSPVVSIEVGDTSFTPLSDLKNDMYYWRVSCGLDFNAFSQVDSILIDTTVGFEEDNDKIEEVLLSTDPNPFNPSTRIIYQLPSPQSVRLDIYNVRGEKIQTLANSFKTTGRHTIYWNSQNRSSGIYYFKLTAGNHIAVKKGILLK
jgi:hypothetical protein